MAQIVQRRADGTGCQMAWQHPLAWSAAQANVQRRADARTHVNTGEAASAKPQIGGDDDGQPPRRNLEARSTQTAKN